MLIKNKFTCILCNSSNLKIVANLKSQDIIKSYKARLDIDITDQFYGLNIVCFLGCNECGLFFFQPQLCGTAKFYENLQSNEDDYYLQNRNEFTIAKKYISNKDSVLEIGAGSGCFAENLSCKSYFGLEYNDKAIEEAKKKNIKLLNSKVEDFALSCQTKFDIVCSFHVLEHVENPSDFIESSIKLLNKNGKIIIAVPCNDSFLSKNVNHILNLPPHHISRWSKKSLLKLCELYNLKLIDLQIDKVENVKGYFENKYMYFFSKYFLNKSLINETNFYRFTFKLFKYLNRNLNLYKLDRTYKPGKNMIVILQKN